MRGSELTPRASQASRRRRLALGGVAVAVVVPLLGISDGARADDETPAATVVGELVQAWPEFQDPAEAAERGQDGPLSWIEPEHGDAVRVPTEDVEHLEVGSIVEVAVGDVVPDSAADEGLEPAREVLATEVLEPAPVEPPVSGTLPPSWITNEVTVVMVVPAGGARDGTTLAEVVAAVNDSVADFWSRETQTTVGVGVTGQFDWPAAPYAATCADPTALWNEAQAKTGFVPGAGRHLMLYLPENSTGCAYGMAQVRTGPGDGGRLYVTDTATSLIAHELGHNFGLGHSSAVQCDRAVDSGSCRVLGYGDYYDVMGASWDEVGTLNAPQAAQLGQLRPLSDSWGGYVDVPLLDGPPMTYRLTPYNGDASTRVVLRLVGDDGAAYWLEYRTPEGPNAWLGDPARNWTGLQSGVLLRRTPIPSDPTFGADGSLLLDGSPSAPAGWATDRQTALSLGQTVRVVAGDFTVTVRSATPTEAQVEVSKLTTRTGNPLVRSPDNGTVYLMTATAKHVIADVATLGALAPLGRIEIVSQQYLDRWPTGSRVSRVVGATDGTVYFLDAGIKLPFASCALVEQFGQDCASVPRLAPGRFSGFVNGPPITPLYRTTSGKAFYVDAGTKREVVDNAALTAAGLPTAAVTLLETGLGYLPYGTPITRDGVALVNRTTGGITLSLAGGFLAVPEPLRAATPLRSLPMRALDDASLRRLAVPAISSPVVQEAGGPRIFLLTESGRREITDPGMAPASPAQVSASFLSLFPDVGTFGGAGFVKGSADGSVYVLDEGRRRAVGSWSHLLALNSGNASPSILTVDQRLASLLPAGPAQMGPGALIHSPRSRTVFLVNGASELIPVGSFNTTAELGATGVMAVTDAVVDSYTVRGSGLGTAVDCSGTRYLGLGGQLHEVGADVAAHYALAYTILDPRTCAAFPKAWNLTRFLRADDGSIYYVENGAKRPIRSYGAYLALGGTPSNTIQVSTFALSRLPTGPYW